MLRGQVPFIQQLPFESRSKTETESSTTSSRHRRKSYSSSTPLVPPSPSSTSRSSQQRHVVRHVLRRSRLPRQNIFSKGVNVKNHQQPPPPPPRRPLQKTQTQASDEADSPQIFERTSVNETSVEDPAMSQLRKLCMDIVKSAEEGTSPPQRAEIKEVVVAYHRSRNNPISPRDPNFTEIPPEFSHVLTYGLARSQPVQQTTAEPSNARRSRFCEIKVEGQQINDSLLYRTVEVGPSDVESCVTLPSTIDDGL